MWQDRLAGCPLALWINLDRAAQRRARMEWLLKSCDVRNERIPAVDGLRLDGTVLCNGTGTNSENACTASHILAMRHFLTNHPDEELVLILEDDASAEYMPYWQRSIGEYINSALPHAGFLQLCVMHANHADVNMMDPLAPVLRPSHNWFSTCAYVVQRRVAESLVQTYTYEEPGGRIIVDLRHAIGSIHADIFLFGSAPTYSIPLFTYTCDTSFIHLDHLKSHDACKRNVLKWWMEKTGKI